MKPEQITAWALDEASTEERQQLEAKLLENPQDKQKADETKAFCDFLLSELRDDSLSLTDKQRERLVEQSSRLPAASGTLAQPPAASGSSAKTTRWKIGVIVRLSLAACAVLGGFWTWLDYSSRHSEARTVVSVAEKPAIKVQLAPKPDATKKAAQEAEARLLAAAPVKPVLVAELPAAKPLAPMPKSEPVAAVSALALNKDQRAMTPGDVQRLKQVQDENAYGLSFDGKPPVPAVELPGMETNQTALVAAPSPVGSSGLLVSTSSTIPLGTGSLTLNGSGAVAAAPPVTASPSRSLSIPPVATALLQQPQHRLAASLSLKGGFYPPQRGGFALASDVMEIDGFINLYVPTWREMGKGFRVDFSHRVLVAPQKTGLVSCLLPGAQILTPNGWPQMPQAQPGVIVTAVGPDMIGSLADYQPALGMGFLRLNQGSYNTPGGAWLMLTAAYASTGSITVQEAGAPLPGTAVSSTGFNIFIFRAPGSVFSDWLAPAPYMNANSEGLIFFATTANLQLNVFHDSGSISAADQSLLGGLLPRNQHLSVYPAALADSSRLSEMQAAVFNTNGLIDGVDLMGAPTVTTKSGTRATMGVTREFIYPMEAAMSQSSFKFEGESASSMRYAPAVSDASATQPGSLAGAGTMIATGSTAVTSTPVATASSGPIAGGSGTVTSVGNAVPETLMNSRNLDSLVLNGASSDAGANTYSGGTTVNGGTVQLTNGAAKQFGDGFAPTGEAILGGKTQMKRSAGATLDLNGGVLASTTPAAPAAKPLVAGTAGSSNQRAFSPMKDEFGTTVSIGYDSNYVWRGNNQGQLGGRADFSGSLEGEARSISPSMSPPSVSFNNSGSIANSDGSYQLSGSSVGGMNDGKELTLGANTNLGPTSHLDLNEAAKVAAAATSNPDAAPLVGTGGTLAPSQGYATFGSLTLIEAKPQAAAAGANSISFSSTGPQATGGNVQPAATTALQPGMIRVVANVTPAPAPAGTTAQIAANPTTVTSTADIPPVELQIVSAADVRYFSLNEPSIVAMKDLEQEQAKMAFGKSGRTDGETYTRIIENELKDVAREPLSTLSIDVDTASYANVRRFLNQNMIPPPDAVRIEELVNYFPTSEEGPAHDAKEPFGVRVELAPCPWQPVHRLARIAIKGREMDKDRKASNLVFLVDVSGSMNEPAKLPLVQQSLRMLTEQLGEGDRVTMVVYAGSSGVVLPPTSGEKKEEILAAIGRLSAGGSTHGSAGIKLAYEQAVAGFIKGGVNRVILCTDGDFNVGTSSPEELEKLIKHKAKTGVFLSVLGFGSGNLKDRTMETLADKGNGNYAYIDSLSEARKVLVEQMSGTLVTIAKDVKIQVEFNPAAVRSYRLIGYENRLLAKEDFNDDTKDAGEIGAGHSVVALYEIVPANLPPGAEPRPLVDSLKYQAPAISSAQLAAAAKTGEMMTVKLRYKEPESDLSKLIEMPTKDEGKTLTASSDEFKFSASVAGFGLLLRDSSYKGTLSWETVRRLALDGKGTDKQGYRGEFLQLIDKARGLKETR